MSKQTDMAGLNPDQRMKILKMAMDLESANGVDAVLGVYDRMVERVSEGVFILSGPDIKAADLVSRFLEHRWDKKQGAEVQASHFYEAFCIWCKGHRVAVGDVPSQHRVGRVMRTMYDVRKSANIYYVGLEVKKD